MTTHYQPSARRVLVGTDSSGDSRVVRDGTVPAVTLADGIRLEELWQQRSFPATPVDEPAEAWSLGPDAPPVGAVVVRMLTVPGAGASPQQVNLHSDPSLHVITLLEGELDFVLATDRVTLLPGQTIVLRDSMHDMSNRLGTPARIVYTSFPCLGGPSLPA